MLLNKALGDALLLRFQTFAYEHIMHGFGVVSSSTDGLLLKATQVEVRKLPVHDFVQSTRPRQPQCSGLVVFRSALRRRHFWR